MQDALGNHIPNTMEPGPSGNQVIACPPVRVASLMKQNEARDKAGRPPLLPHKYITDLERNQKIASCCRHPENHVIVALCSDPTDKTFHEGTGEWHFRPDIYKNICTCGRVHTRFCLGDDPRPFWTAR